LENYVPLQSIHVLAVTTKSRYRDCMDLHDLAGLLLLTAATACGSRTGPPSDGDGAAGSANSSSGAPSCTLTIDEGSTISAFIAKGERFY
jgi:hypothetical protein